MNIFDQTKDTVGNVKVTRETRWACQQCGKCCHITPENRDFMVSLIGEPKDDGSCRHLTKDNLCSIYNKRPLICRLYPFFMNLDDLKKGVVDISFGKLTIDMNTSGFGKGESVVENKKLKEKLAAVAKQIKLKMIEKKQGTLKEVFYER